MCAPAMREPFGPELRPADDGRAHDAVDIVNHLARWLSPRLLDPVAADRIQAAVAALTGDLDAEQRSRLHSAALRWLT
ncbi:MAG: hypothetical protein ACK5OX_09780 [Desertimonas sp.]